MGVFLLRHLLFVSLPNIRFLVFLLLVCSTSAMAFTQFRLGRVGRLGIGKAKMSGLGSWPPSCRSKCGRCYPCGAVHVPIQPGLSMPLEYYPEAWRCKCGDKLFIP